MTWPNPIGFIEETVGERQLSLVSFSKRILPQKFIKDRDRGLTCEVRESGLA